MDITLNHQDIVNAIAYYVREVKHMEPDTMVLSSKDTYSLLGSGVFYDEYQTKQVITAKVKVK